MKGRRIQGAKPPSKLHKFLYTPLMNMLTFKGSDRLCKVIELSVQFGDKLKLRIYRSLKNLTCLK